VSTVGAADPVALGLADPVSLPEAELVASLVAEPEPPPVDVAAALVVPSLVVVDPVPLLELLQAAIEMARVAATAATTHR
jgi:hypothetical protein